MDKCMMQPRGVGGGVSIQNFKAIFSMTVNATRYIQDRQRVNWPRPPLAHYHYVRHDVTINKCAAYIEARLQTAAYSPAGRRRNGQMRLCTLLSRNDSLRSSVVRPSNESPDLVACIRRASPRTDCHVTGSARSCLSTFKDLHIH